MKKSTWLCVGVAMLALPMLTACKSKSRNCNTCGVPGTAAPAAPMAQAPGWTPPPAANFDTGAPVAPPMADAPIGAPAVPFDSSGGDPLLLDGSMAPPSDVGVGPTSADLEGTPAMPADDPAFDNRIRDFITRNRELSDRLDRLDSQPAVSAPTSALDATPYPSGAVPTATDSLASDLRRMGGLEVFEEGGEVIVRVTNAFRSGSDQLKGDAALMNSLRDTASVLAKHPNARVQVVGHSDTTPIKVSGWANNTALSEARARRVATLLGQNGVSNNRIETFGRGEMEPLVMPERTSADRARNRRVEIRISR